MSKVAKDSDQKKSRNPMYEYMRDLRARSGLPQKEVADRLGIRQEAVAQWEREAGNPPGITTIPRLAEIYGVKEQEIMDQRQACGAKMRTARSPDLDFEAGKRPKIFGVPLPCLVSVQQEDLTGQILDAIRNPAMLWRAVNEECDTRSFFYRNDSKALEPMIPSGAWIAFDPMRKPRSGCIVLVRRVTENNESILMVRQYVVDEPQKILMGATLESWPATSLLPTDQILAVGIEVQIPLSR